MKKFLGLLIFLGLVLCSCAPYRENTTTTETNQQDQGVSALLSNQPVPNLGGHSTVRQILIQLELAQNKVLNTYTYTMTIDGTIIYVCPSIGYPIPGGTQLTNPTRVSNGGSLSGTGTGNTTIGNPEPNGTYPPASSAGTYIMCVNPDGTISPEYWEPNMFSLPYKVKADKSLQPLDNTPPTISIKP